MTEPANPIVCRENRSFRKNTLSVLKFRDQAILVSIDSLNMGVNVHMTVLELQMLQDAITTVLNHQGTESI